jgi:hypothetical protein
VVHSLINRAATICTEKQEYSKVLVKIRQDLAMNGYPQHLINYAFKEQGQKADE